MYDYELQQAVSIVPHTMFAVRPMNVELGGASRYVGGQLWYNVLHPPEHPGNSKIFQSSKYTAVLLKFDAMSLQQWHRAALSNSHASSSTSTQSDTRL